MLFECFEPFEIKKISVQVEDNMYNSDFEPNVKFCNNTCINSSLRDSPFKLVNTITAEVEQTLLSHVSIQCRQAAVIVPNIVSNGF